MSSSKTAYHRYVPDPEWSRFGNVDTTDPYKYSRAIVNAPNFEPQLSTWLARLQGPFRGITVDGTPRENLYRLRDEGAPTAAMRSSRDTDAKTEQVAAANALLGALSLWQRQKAVHSLDSEEWRKWANPEFIIFDCGIRLEHLGQHQIDLVHELLRQSLGEKGFAKVRGATKTNRFLGEIANKRAILNEGSYHLMLFGAPSATEPWGYTLTGHHLSLNIFVVGPQMTISPVFIGAEPSIIDAGPDKGIELCSNESRLGLQLMQSLSPKQQRLAQVYAQMNDPAMPPDRWNIADQRHVAGAFSDNRVIPYEGICAAALSASQQEALFSTIEAFLELLPLGPLEARLQQVRKHVDTTWFSWIGGFGDDDPFYYRVQSPVVLVELDNHSGVFLTNEEPAKYHIHTIVRTPNGNDYARELVRQYREQKKSG
ncbi:hypothetical protein SLS56_002300 [Neofusicoccum ribis]|uniref:DUF3500 domain-containing protein n=1 Tax=Neofusicoccum ribis TaxID=45134 RepID=A0ABR3T615_9PEZI